VPAEPDSVRRGGATDLGGSRAHLPTPVEDVDGDGIADLVIHVNMSTTGLQPEDTEAGVTGMLLDGTSVQGCDAIHVISA